jgi:hypothetical protein
MIQFIETVSKGMFNRMHVCLVTIDTNKAFVRMAGNETFGVLDDEATALITSIRTMPGVCDVQNYLINLVQVARVRVKPPDLRVLEVFFADGTNWRQSEEEAKRIYEAILGQKRIYDAQMQAYAAMMQQQQNLVQPASNFPGLRKT